MRNRTIAVLWFILSEVSLVLPLVGDQKPVFFVFGGNQLYVGMTEGDAVAALSTCCILSPPPESKVGQQPARPGVVGAHFIFLKDDSLVRILGTIYFSGGKVLRITRPLTDEVDTWNGEVVNFTRAIKRSLPVEANDLGVTVVVRVRHERIRNGESDVVSLVFPNGQGIEVSINTLDKPNAYSHKRDFVTLDETLEPPR